MVSHTFGVCFIGTTPPMWETCGNNKAADYVVVLFRCVLSVTFIMPRNDTVKINSIKFPTFLCNLLPFSLFLCVCAAFLLFVGKEKNTR